MRRDYYIQDCKGGKVITQTDEKGELHPVVPSKFEGGVFLVIVQNNESGENYTQYFRLFNMESDAEKYAATFTQYWITTKIVLLPDVK